ncbi:hypothetical protein B0T24DRAFT_135116 [Lasiosphaeria ovina]|uniref:BHLH domain-containing protein n=1 Tax=Lasiosphaeria ovina TaxID=92902 RepID=A0AAE0JSU6_9PEZI|nr:hypothetical protein B0T24DRAFT_135116 [Lasiosphaeria ovina]
MSDQAERQRLADEKWKARQARHITFEQRRRRNIRDGFERLSAIVPGAEGKAQCESVVLKHTVDFIHEQLKEREALIRELEARGETVDPALKTGYLEGPRSLAVLEIDEIPGYQEAGPSGQAALETGETGETGEIEAGYQEA